MPSGLQMSDVAKGLGLVVATALVVSLTKLPGYAQGKPTAAQMPQSAIVQPLLQSTPPVPSPTIAQVDERQIEAERLLDLGVEQALQSQFHAAIASWQQALTLYREISDRAGEADALTNLGIAYRNLGQAERAIDVYEQALMIARALGDRAREDRILNNLGAVYNSLGQYERAIDIYQQALPLFQTSGDHAREAATLGNLGIAHDNLGQYEQAISFFEQSLTRFQTLDDQANQGRTLLNLGITHENLGQYGQAIVFYEQALTIAREIGDRGVEGSTLGNLGVAYRNLGEYDRAIDFYEQALTIAREIGNRGGESDALGNLGVAYDNLDQPERAIDFYEQALAIAQEIGNLGGEGRALGNLGLAYNKLGEYDRAIELYEQAIAIARTIGDPVIEGNNLNNLGTILLGADRFAEAEMVLRQSIDIFESLRADLSDAQLIAIADAQARVYTNLEVALIAQGKFTEALVITERGRAQAFALQLVLRQDAAAENPVTIPSINDIQSIAQEQNATLVSYSLIFGEALYIWVISPSGDIQFRSVTFDGADSSINPIATIDGPVDRGDESSSEINRLVADTRAGIGVVGELPSQRLQSLHQVLIAPIADLLPTNPNANVVFIPQGSLFLVPFAALQAENGTHLIEKHTLTTAPSIQVLRLAREQLATASPNTPSILNRIVAQALVVGNPEMPTIPSIQLASLPGAEAEALAISALLDVTPLIGNQATETLVKQQLPTASLIHLATHGLLNYRDTPFDIPGALALTAGGGDDGFLTANEILDLDLQAQLAILSACDTGRGEITGDGVVGLSRAFITAGVPSVVVSLWAVPDAPTARLMTEFYRQLSQGQTKAQALRQAMLMTMVQHPEPRNWAAFTLIGVDE